MHEKNPTNPQKPTTNPQKPIIALAPMMNRTDRHFRYLARLFSPSVRLYTEMISTAHILKARDPLIFRPEENYLALQLGGSDPEELALCAKIGEDYGYDEINLNVGCPSSRVKAAQFGASLMLNPNLVAQCILAMTKQVKIPITIKCRIGVDDKDSYADLCRFINLNREVGCNTFIIHARKAWLSGLNPKQNRSIPPLRYDVVKQIKVDFPNLTILINGGFKTVTDVYEHAKHVDGIMIGREAYSNPFMLSLIEQKYESNTKLLTRSEVINKFLPYVENELKAGVKLTNISRHLLGLFQGQCGAKVWRRYLSQHAHQPGAGIEVIEKALELINEVKN